MHLVVMMEVVGQLHAAVYITKLGCKVPPVTLKQANPLTQHHLCYVLLPYLLHLLGYLLYLAWITYVFASQLHQTLHVLLSFQHFL